MGIIAAIRGTLAIVLIIIVALVVLIFGSIPNLKRTGYLVIALLAAAAAFNNWRK